MSGYSQLHTRVLELGANLLPSSFSNSGSYTDAQADQIRGYILLVHAEVEHYLEDLVKERVLQSKRVWDDSAISDNTLLSLIAFFVPKSRQDKRFILSECVGDAVSNCFHTISNNHGIKEANLRDILHPVGIDLESIENMESNWVFEMSNFGSNRCDIAHKSANSVTWVLDPEAEQKRVLEKILPGLKEIENVLFPEDV